MFYWILNKIIGTSAILLSISLMNLEEFYNDSDFLIKIPDRASTVISVSDEISPTVRVSLDMLEVIKSRPLFIESRRSHGQESLSETATVFIDGSHKTVELIGTIESSDQRIAAFALEGQITIWVQKDDYLGDWQIKNITRQKVRLAKDSKTRLMQIRKTTSAAALAVER